LCWKGDGFVQGVLFVREAGKCLSRMAFPGLSTVKVPSLCFKVTDLCGVRPARQGSGAAPGEAARAPVGAIRRQGDVVVRASRQGDGPFDGRHFSA
jgi:hypothetical protein